MQQILSPSSEIFFIKKGYRTTNVRHEFYHSFSSVSHTVSLLSHYQTFMGEYDNM